MKKKLESFRLIIDFKEVELPGDTYKTLEPDILHAVEKTLFKNYNIGDDKYNLTVVSTEKTLSEVLVEKEHFRIVRTKNCKALVQKKKTNNGKSFIWEDEAFFSQGTKKECLDKAEKELKRLSKKKPKGKKKSGSSKKKRSYKTQKQKYRENIPKKDMDIMKKYVNLKSD